MTHTAQQLLAEAEKFITGIANSTDAGFVKAKRAREWLRDYAALQSTSHVLVQIPLDDLQCLAAWMLPHLRNHPDSGPDCRLCFVIAELERLTTTPPRVDPCPNESPST